MDIQAQEDIEKINKETDFLLLFTAFSSPLPYHRRNPSILDR